MVFFLFIFRDFTDCIFMLKFYEKTCNKISAAEIIYSTYLQK
jgi:hypothetical protein